ncbi:MAG: hypothetical protein ABIJ09_27615 [Pseudomonadota bacterium]
MVQRSCALVLVAGLGLAACGEFLQPSSDGDAGSDGGGCSTEFCDDLRFGTGLGGTGFDLLGETNSFSVASMATTSIFFRLESAADFDSRFVRLYIYSGSGSNSAPYWQNDFVPGQSYGHILLSTFRITDQGSYEVRAYLVTNMGAETHVITMPITMTQ